MTYSEDLLTQRVRQLLITVRSTTSVYLFPIPEPGRYDPRTLPPAFLWIRDSLNPHERLLATVHELTHACLHPPGCGDYDEAAYCNEEPCSHEATGMVCVDYAITDYRLVMERLGVPPECFRSGDPMTVEVMVERVRAALETPDVFPAWATAVLAT